MRGDAGEAGPFRVAAASISGLGHIQRGTTGQDAYHFALTDDALVAAVADGLGSHSITQIGAEIAARSVCAALRSVTAVRASDPRDELAAAVAATNSELTRIRELAFTDLADRDLETTLGFCWISRTDPHWAVAGRVGDCEVFALRRGSFEPLFEREEGPLNRVSGVLPAADASHALEVRAMELADISALVLGTDGLANDVAGSPAVARWLAERWERPCGVHWMIDSLRYRRQGSHDDRTALVIWPAPAVTP